MMSVDISTRPYIHQVFVPGGGPSARSRQRDNSNSSSSEAKKDKIDLNTLRDSSKSLQQLPLESIKNILKKAKRSAFPPGSVICRQGEKCEMMVYIVSGTVNLHAHSPEALAAAQANKAKNQDAGARSAPNYGPAVAAYSEGRSFGESALLTIPGLWPFTAVAQERCDCLVLSLAAFLAQLDPVTPRLELSEGPLTLLRKPSESRTKEALEELAQSEELLAHPFFHELPSEFVAKLLSKVKVEQLQPQVCIFKQGEIIDHTRLIVSGSVSLHVAISDSAMYRTPHSQASTSGRRNDYDSDEDGSDDDDTPGKGGSRFSPHSRRHRLDEHGSPTSQTSFGSRGQGDADWEEMHVNKMYGECVKEAASGACIGEVALGKDQQQLVSALTREETTVLLISREDFVAAQAAALHVTGNREGASARVRRLLGKMESVRTESDLDEIMSMMQNVHTLASQPIHTARGLCRVLRFREIQPGGILTRQGEKGDGMYLIIGGSAAVYRTPDAHKDREEGWANVRTMEEPGKEKQPQFQFVHGGRPLELDAEIIRQGCNQHVATQGACIGEKSLNVSTSSTVTVVSLDVTEVIYLSKVAYNHVLRKTEQMQRQAKVRLLQSVPALCPVPKQALERLAASIEHLTLKQGDEVFKAGDQANHCFLISRGLCQPEAGEGDRLVAPHQYAVGELLGVQQVVRGGRYSETIQVVSESAEMYSILGEALVRHTKGLLMGLIKKQDPAPTEALLPPPVPAPPPPASKMGSFSGKGLKAEEGGAAEDPLRRSGSLRRPSTSPAAPGGPQPAGRAVEGLSAPSFSSQAGGSLARPISGPARFHQPRAEEWDEEGLGMRAASPPALTHAQVEEYAKNVLGLDLEADKELVFMGEVAIRSNQRADRERQMKADKERRHQSARPPASRSLASLSMANRPKSGMPVRSSMQEDAVQAQASSTFLTDVRPQSSPPRALGAATREVWRVEEEESADFDPKPVRRLGSAGPTVGRPASLPAETQLAVRKQKKAVPRSAVVSNTHPQAYLPQDHAKVRTWFDSLIVKDMGEARDAAVNWQKRQVFQESFLSKPAKLDGRPSNAKSMELGHSKGGLGGGGGAEDRCIEKSQDKTIYGPWGKARIIGKNKPVAEAAAIEKTGSGTLSHTIQGTGSNAEKMHKERMASANQLLRIPKPNKVVHEVVAQDFDIGTRGELIKIMYHLREDIPKLKLEGDKRERTIEDCTRMLFKRKIKPALANLATKHKNNG